MRTWIIALFFAATPALAADHDAELAAAQQQMQATFAQAIVTDFRESPIPGLYEAYLVDKLIYYHPEKELLILGEIWTKDGRSLTAARRAELAANLIDQIPLDQALVIGPEHGVPVVEFTDPDCPYCRAFHAFAQKSGQVPIKRQVFFETRAHPQAEAKAVHILCAPDPAKAFAEVYGGQTPERLNDCAAGRKRLAVHRVLSEKAGVSVTPTLYVDRTPILGFRRAVIEEALSSHGVPTVERGE